MSPQDARCIFTLIVGEAFYRSENEWREVAEAMNKIIMAKTDEEAAKVAESLDCLEDKCQTIGFARRVRAIWKAVTQ